ncbi:kinase-like domain-containing protein, partial [Ephemerocybe angulata]
GLRCLHELGVMHRNIKPSSFLVNLDGRLMLSDFTHSYIRSDAGEPLEEGLRYAYRVRGRLEYMAPEMRAMARQKKAHDQAGTMDLDEAIPGLAGYGREADVWSLGCVIAELLRVCEGKKFRVSAFVVYNEMKYQRYISAAVPVLGESAHHLLSVDA